MNKEQFSSDACPRASEALLQRMLNGACGCETEQDSVSYGCGRIKGDTYGLEGYAPASVYAPLQQFRDLYDLDHAMEAGTVFEQLDLPFLGRSVWKGGKSC